MKLRMPHTLFPHCLAVVWGLGLVLLLAGCASAPPVRPAPVPVPVAAERQPLPPKPALPYETLRAGASSAETIEALTNSLGLCVRYSQALEIHGGAR